MVSKERFGLFQTVMSKANLRERDVFSNGVVIRELQSKDRGAIKHLLRKIHQFTDEERNCVVELVDIYLSQDEGTKDYEFLVAVDGSDGPYGFISFGDISLTDACYDLYWIVCDPAVQHQGIGTRLLNALEEILKVRGVRKLFAETSSKVNYKLACNFYEKRGFKLTAKMPDFYKVGDDKLVYVKDL